MRVAACQPPALTGDLDAAIGEIRRMSAEAETMGADLVCFPEAYLQGYLVEPHHVVSHALEFGSTGFELVLSALSDLEPMLVLGLFERVGNDFFNSAVVIQQGRLLGRYRKRNLIGTERAVFRPGDACPVFDCAGGRFAINICSDTRDGSYADEAARAGAQVLVCPSNNLMALPVAQEWKHRHNQVRSRLAASAGLWLVSSDVTGTLDKKISYGPTGFIDPTGRVLEQVPLGEVGLRSMGLPVGAATADA